MNNNIYSFIIICVIFFACKDENVIINPELTSIQASQDHLLAEQIFNDIGMIIEQGYLENSQIKGCPEYSLINVDTTDIDTLIIDFGSENCLFAGKLRQGKIINLYNGKYRTSFSRTTTTFENYYINNNLVQGERIITNKGVNNQGNIYYEIEVVDASITTENGIINWSSNIEKELIAGSNTYDIYDDIYTLSGNANGIGVNNNSFSAIITKNLNIELDCISKTNCVINSGETIISPNGYSDRTINYGVGLCDCNIDIIIEGNIYPVILN